MLDPERASPIYGSSRARWRQDGRYYDAAGKLISAEEAALPAEEPPPEAMPAPLAPGEYPTFHYPEQASKAKPATTAVVVEAPQPPTSRQARLEAMPNTQLAKLVTAAGGEPARGKGANRVNIDWLLAHTEDG